MRNSPRRATLEKEDAAIMALDEQLKKGAATMSVDARTKMQDEIGKRQVGATFSPCQLLAQCVQHGDRLLARLVAEHQDVIAL